MKDNQSNISQKSIAVLSSVFPEDWMALVRQWISESPVTIQIVKSRRSKKGDFRPARLPRETMITLNEDLHPVEMMITLAHEMAHLRVWKRYVIRKKPHGKEWKAEFRRMLKELIDSDLLETSINQAIVNCYFKREGIGSGSCLKLYQVLHAHDEHRRVQDLPEGETFVLRGGRTFIKGPRLRTRYRCKELKTGKIYAVHPLAEVL